MKTEVLDLIFQQNNKDPNQESPFVQTLLELLINFFEKDTNQKFFLEETINENEEKFKDLWFQFYRRNPIP